MRTIAIAALLLGGPVALANPPSAKPAKAQKQQLKMPNDAKLIGVEEASEVRAFPELAQGQPTSATNKQAQTKPIEKIEGVRAVDSVYASDKSFDDTVRFFDQALKDKQYQPVVKTRTDSAVGWSAKLPSGKMAHVLVRNTQPTTIETIEAVADEGEVNANTDKPGVQPKVKGTDTPGVQSPDTGKTHLQSKDTSSGAQPQNNPAINPHDSQ